MFVKHCPKCGSIVLKDKKYDVQYCMDCIVEFYCGHCVKCNTNYQWESYFQWAVDSELEEKPLDKGTNM